jgi:hypothetical protein
VEQESGFPIHLNSKEKGKARAWLQLRSGQRGVLGDFSFGDMGGDSTPFEGMWAIELLVDGELALRNSFRVSCVE